MRALVLSIVVALVATAAAQPPGATRGGPAPGPNPQQRIENIKRRIRGMRAAAIVEALKPDQQTAGKLFTVLDKYDAVFDRLLVERTDLVKRIANVGGMRDPRAIDKLIDDAIANQRAFWDTEDKRLAELRKLLTPQQTAKLLVVLPEFERRLQNQLRNAILRQQGPRKQPAGDDDLDAP